MPYSSDDMDFMFGARLCIKRKPRQRGELSNLFSTRNFLMISSLDYLFQLAVEMKKLGIPWLSDIA